MSVKQILPGLYQISPSYFNVFLIDSGELILVDVGDPNNTKAIQKAVQAIGKQMTDIRHILVTHCHRDHAGSLATVKQITRAPAYMYPIDAAAVRTARHEWNTPSRHQVSSTRSDFIPSVFAKLMEQGLNQLRWNTRSRMGM